MIIVEGNSKNQEQMVGVRVQVHHSVRRGVNKIS